jgi:hypothetical protein
LNSPFQQITGKMNSVFFGDFHNTESSIGRCLPAFYPYPASVRAEGQKPIALNPFLQKIKTLSVGNGCNPISLPRF